MFDPRTSTFSEYPIERSEPDATAGSRDLIIDPHDNVWLPMRLHVQATSLYKFDTATKKATKVEGFTASPYGDAAPNGSHVRLSFVGVDATTAKLDGDFRKPASGIRPQGYGFVVNSKDQPFGTDYMGSGVTSVDIEKNEGKFWPTPRPDMLPRRGRMDKQDR